MKKYFTLIELLVVIAIIAILAAILMPALNQARAKAQAIRCVSNIKQCAAALNMYTNDYNGFTSGPHLNTPEGYTRWYGVVGVYSGKFQNFAEYISLAEGEGGKRMHKLLRCPAAELWPDSNTYAYNGDNQTNLDTGRKGMDVRPISKIRNASRIMWCGDGKLSPTEGEANAFRVNIQWMSTADQLLKVTWHGKNANYAMADGHAIQMTWPGFMEAGYNNPEYSGCWEKSVFWDNGQWF